MKTLLGLLCSLTLSSLVHATDSLPNAAPDTAGATGLGGGVVAGTTGFGVQIGKGLGDNFAVRGLASFFSYTRTGSLDGFSYSGNLNLNTFGAYGDWFPFGGVFRLTGGVDYDNSKIDITGVPQGATYTINGHTYPSTSVNSVTGSMTFSKTAPYLGMGWGRLGRPGFSATADLGVLYIGRPNVSLSGQCGSTPLAREACPTIQSDITAERARLQSDAGKYRYLPVITLGLGYTF